MNPRIRRILAWVGYPAFYLACLMVFAYVSAPWDRLKNAFTTGFNSGSPLRMEIEKLSWSWHFPGIAASGVKFIGTAPAAPDASGKPRPAPEYVVDDMYARVSVFPLLWGTTKIGFSLDGFGGGIGGMLKNASEDREFELEFDDVDAGKMPYLTEFVGAPVAGTVSGKIELKLPQGKLTTAEGTISLHIVDFAVGDGKSKIRDTIALPRLNAGKLDLEAEVTEGNVKITQFSTQGTDLELVSDGRIRLMDRMESSLAEINIRYKFSEAYKNKDDMTRGLFGAPNSNVPGLMDLDPKVKMARRDDGFYAWHVTGPLSSLNFQPAGGSTGDSSARARRPPVRGFARPPSPAARPAAPPAAPAPPPPEPAPNPEPPPPPPPPPPLPVPPPPPAAAPPMMTAPIPVPPQAPPPVPTPPPVEAPAPGAAPPPAEAPQPEQPSQ
jgi:type II secretion system protein N